MVLPLWSHLRPNFTQYHDSSGSVNPLATLHPERHARWDQTSESEDGMCRVACGGCQLPPGDRRVLQQPLREVELVEVRDEGQDGLGDGAGKPEEPGRDLLGHAGPVLSGLELLDGLVDVAR